MQRRRSEASLGLLVSDIAVNSLQIDKEISLMKKKDKKTSGSWRRRTELEALRCPFAGQPQEGSGAQAPEPPKFPWPSFLTRIDNTYFPRKRNEENTEKSIYFFSLVVLI